MAKGPSASELFRLWQAGDKMAGQELYLRLEDALRGRVRGAIRGARRASVDSGGIAASAFGSFDRLRRANRKRGPLSFENTVNMMAYFGKLLKKKLRNDRVGPGPIDSEALPEVPDPSPDPAVQVAQDDSLSAALARLKPFSRKVAELIVQDYSVKEIKDALKCSRHTVRRTLKGIGEVLFGDAARDQEVRSERILHP